MITSKSLFPSKYPLVLIYTDGATVGQNGKLGTVTQVGLGIHMERKNHIPGHKNQINMSVKTNGISNNEAEFKALIYGMEQAIAHKVKNAIFYSDSTIIVNRANGKRPKKKKFTNPRMDAFQDKVLQLASEFDSIQFIWIPREQNMIADQLSKQACLQTTANLSYPFSSSPSSLSPHPVVTE